MRFNIFHMFGWQGKSQGDNRLLTNEKDDILHVYFAVNKYKIDNAVY